MITFLDGKLVGGLPPRTQSSMSGALAGVLIPLSATRSATGTGHSFRILTHLAVREDAHVLYGFMMPAERDLFRLLVNNVSGIGPKLALAVLSGMSVNNFKAAVVNSDVTAISKISGLGKKTAERIILELKDKLGVAAAWEAASAAHAPTPEEEQANEAVLALIALGYKQIDAHKAVRGERRRNRRKNWLRSLKMVAVDEPLTLTFLSMPRVQFSNGTFGVGRWPRYAVAFAEAVEAGRLLRAKADTLDAG